MKNKTLKINKLRNNEYYGRQDIYDALYSKSKKGQKFNKLMLHICSEENILLAFRNLRNNSGSMTSGLDGKNILSLKSLTNEQLIQLVRNKLENYQPQKVKRVYIPKPNGKSRPLGIPTISDRLVQQCVLQIMEPICEAKFYEHSYGFRPTRGTGHAIARAYYLAQRANLHYVVDIDIKSYFDTINHKKLIQQLWTFGFRDKNLISIIKKMLQAEIEGIGISIMGTPQGGILSPLLSNIVLTEFDNWIDSQWKSFNTKNDYFNQGTKIRAMKQTNLKEIYIVRYADDFKIFCRNYHHAKRIFEASKMWLRERLELEISSEKSKIVNLRTNYSDFLGIKMKVVKSDKRKNKDKWIIKSYISDKNLARIKETMKNKVKAMQKPKGNPADSVYDYNAYVMGVQQYYSCATHCNKNFTDIASVLLKSLRNRLKGRKRFNGSFPEYMKRYAKSTEKFKVYNVALAPIGYAQHIKQMNHSQKSIFGKEGRESFHRELQEISQNELSVLLRNPVRDQSVMYNDNRISLYVAQKGKCSITKSKLNLGNFHCHHKLPKSLGGTDEYRNLILISYEVHMLIHATNKKTIDKYINMLNLDSNEISQVNKLRVEAKNELLVI